MVVVGQSFHHCASNWNIFWMDCREILYRHSQCFGDPLTFLFTLLEHESFHSLSEISQHIKDRLIQNACTDIRVSQMFYDSGDPQP